MAKFSRESLKTLVKECLVELLSDGLSSSINEAVKRPVLQNNSQQQRQNPASTVTPANFVASRTMIGKPTPALEKRVNNQGSQLASALTNDSIMRDILADTANTTMVEQLNEDRQHAGSAGGLPSPAQIPAEVFQTELFEGAGSWADLAFAPRKLPGDKSNLMQ